MPRVSTTKTFSIFTAELRRRVKVNKRSVAPATIIAVRPTHHISDPGVWGPGATSSTDTGLLDTGTVVLPFPSVRFRTKRKDATLVGPTIRSITARVVVVPAGSGESTHATRPSMVIGRADPLSPRYGASAGGGRMGPHPPGAP